jgi:hypothetical protein
MAHRESPDDVPSTAGLTRPLAVVLAVLVVFLGSVLIVAKSWGETTPPAGPVQTEFGVLGSRCDPERATALRDAGVTFAELELAWADFEPAPGEFSREYQESTRLAVERCTQAGIGVVLTLGLHSAPSWVSELPGGAYRNQDGGPGPESVPNLVFSAAVREAVGDYLAELDAVVPLNTLAAIRVGTGGNGELGFPTSGADTADGNPFWGFDSAAQEGEGLAAGMEVTTMPGWAPGDAEWRGEEVTAEDAGNWFRWYSNSVADAAVWVVGVLRQQGFEGDIHLPLAGRGALPADLDAALAARLDGTADRDGSLGGGLYYPGQLERIARSLESTEQPGWGTVSADTASVDDATAVAARALTPQQDSCRPGDADEDLTGNPDVVQWSSFRWTVANARKAGLGVVGENPGSPDTPGTGGNASTDSSVEQLAYAPRYARECGLSLLMWAFEDDLFGGSPGLNVDAYAARIRELPE